MTISPGTLHDVTVTIGPVQTGEFKNLTRDSAEALVVELAKLMYNTSQLQIQIIASS